MMHYVILPPEVVNTVLPERVKAYMGYEQDYTLAEAAFICRKLTNGNYLVSVSLCHRHYVANKCVLNEPTDDDMAFARNFYGPDAIITDIDNLEFAEETE